MAKPKPPQRADPAEALAKLETPSIKWKVIAQVVFGFAIVWLVAFMLTPYVGFWSLVVAGVLTLVAAGFGLYVWRLTRKSAAIVDILKGATDAKGRAAAIAALEAKGGKGGDAMNTLARAQLLAQDNPQEAMRVLESIDLKKAPAVVQDDVRANLALMYLVHNRAKDARPLAEEIRLDRQPQAKAKAMYAAVCAEAFARTGKPDEAMKLLDTYKADDPDYGEMRAMLYRAQVYTYVKLKKRGLAKKAMEQLAQLDPNVVAGFAQKGGHPDTKKMARDVLSKLGAIPKQKMRMRMR